MKLLKLCEPVFQLVCRINRAARGGHELDYEVTRADVRSVFHNLATSAQADASLRLLYEKVRLPLIYFVDSMIVESKINFASEWDQNRLAYDEGQLSGDEAFFDHLEEAMKERSSENDEILTVFYTCLGLGFQGFYFAEPEYIDRKMSEIYPRVRTLMKIDGRSRITPSAYEHTNTTVFFQPASTRLVGIAIAAAVLLLAVLGTVGFLFVNASDDLSKALNDINAQATTTN